MTTQQERKPAAATTNGLAARALFMHHPTNSIAYTTGFVTPVVKHWLEREITQWHVASQNIYPKILFMV